jgi:hypothetical protein
MRSPQLLALDRKPTYLYEPKLGWEKVRPCSGEVREEIADRFVRAQGRENLIPSLTCPAVQAILKAEVSIEQNVVLAYHAEEAQQLMDQAMDDHLGPKWKQSEHSLQAPEPGLNDAYFSASCGGRVYSQQLNINSRDQQIELITRSKDEAGHPVHALRAIYDPTSGEIMPETITSDYSSNRRF